jgi:hypothetical protein
MERRRFEFVPRLPQRHIRVRGNAGLKGINRAARLRASGHSGEAESSDHRRAACGDCELLLCGFAHSQRLGSGWTGPGFWDRHEFGLFDNS